MLSVFPALHAALVLVEYDKIWTENVLLGTKLQIRWVGQPVAAMYNCY